MNTVWLQLVMRVAAAACASLLAGLAAGASTGLGLFALMLFLMLLHHARHLVRLSRWLADPRPEALPESSGLWEDVFAAFYHLLRRQRRSESRLTATLQDFRQAGMAMPDGLVIVDGANQIEWCNPKAELHFGLDAQRDVGQLVTHLVRQPQFSEALDSEGYSEPLTLRSARGGGDLILSVLIVPYEANRKLIISRDVTDRERVETMRRDFVANVSHELRTPLTVIGGFLETIADMETPNPELIRRSVPMMSDQARRMQSLVEDLLTLSRLESAGNPAREEPVNVPDIARALYHDALALSAGRHKVTLLLESKGWVSGAEDELRSAFGNLVSNAVRYTPAGGEVRLSWKNAGDGAVFAVRDTGIGIAPQHVPRLTERFYRVDRGRSRETGGTGLGLAIVKHVVNRHAARLDVTSEPGSGSCFSVVFPGSRVIMQGGADVPATARSA